MKAWYDQGTHLIIDGIHLLFDPTYTTNTKHAVPYEQIQKWQQQNGYNPDYETVDCILVSHAHGDHTDRLDYAPFYQRKLPLIAHPLTFLIRNRMCDKYPAKVPILPGQTVPFKHLQISASYSGHCGGSVMFLIQSRHHRILFTGDLNTQRTISTFPPEPVEADVVITESTFGHPAFSFPNRDGVYREIYEFLHDQFAVKHQEVVVMYGHSLGKVQDLIYLINSFADLHPVILIDGYSLTITRAFERYYAPLGPYRMQTDVFEPEPPTVIINGIQNYTKDDLDTLCHRFGLQNPPIGVATGWNAADGSGEELSESVRPDQTAEMTAAGYTDLHFFMLSSHAGYDDLITFLHACNPAHVCCFHGFSGELAKHIPNELGIGATDLHEIVYDAED
jgi:putative mRNA 3-end processing factor